MRSEEAKIKRLNREMSAVKWQAQRIIRCYVNCKSVSSVDKERLLKLVKSFSFHISGMNFKMNELEKALSSMQKDEQIEVIETKIKAINSFIYDLELYTADVAVLIQVKLI